MSETSPQNVAGADPYNYSTASTYGNLIGGEFLVEGSGESFKSFCLEYGETISLGGTSYLVSIDAGAINGGGPAHGALETVPGHSSLTMDPLSNITTFLYDAYRSSDLAGFDIGASGGGDDFRYGNANWADALQLVFWRAENELTNDYYRDGSLVGNATLHAMANQLYAYAALNAGSGSSNVQVLNLWNGNPYESTARQSQLYKVVDAPEPASLAIWGAGIGLAGLIAARRRKLQPA